MSETLISLITPCYNAEKYLAKTFLSLESQSYKNWEWIVIDDCSRDGSLALLQQIGDKDRRVRIFQNTINSGPSVSRNKGIDEARGEYIAFIDSDDEWFPEKLVSQLQFMQINHVGLTCHNYIIMSEKGVDIKPVRSEFSTVTKDLLQTFNPIATSFVMVKKEVIGKLRFDETLWRRQDWVFWYKLLERVEKCYIIPEILGRYRKDSVHSISKNKFKMAQLQWMIYRRYFNLTLFQSLMAFISYMKYGISKHYLK